MLYSRSLNNSWADFVTAIGNILYCSEIIFSGHNKPDAELVVLSGNRKNDPLTAIVIGCTEFGEGVKVMPKKIGIAKARKERLLVRRTVGMRTTRHVSSPHRSSSLSEDNRPADPKGNSINVDRETFYYHQ
jgi:hypothetical protein